MQIDLNQIVFGNPSLEQAESLKSTNFLDKLFSTLTAYTFPKNDSEAAKAELNYVSGQVVSTLKDSPTKLESYLDYDTQAFLYIQDIVARYYQIVDTDMEVIGTILADINPLIFKLKNHFNRPRPYQLAHYHGIKLYPFRINDSGSASFPSAKSFQSRVICEVIGNYYPEAYEELMALHEDIANSRVSIGVHYPSDVDAGIFGAELVLRDKEFLLKYKI